MMNILTPAIEKKAQAGILDNVMRKEYHQASRQISDTLVELYASIPDENRVSYSFFLCSRVRRLLQGGQLRAE